jgi:hypothetical protein
MGLLELKDSILPRIGLGRKTGLTEPVIRAWIELRALPPGRRMESRGELTKLRQLVDNSGVMG